MNKEADIISYPLNVELNFHDTYASSLIVSALELTINLESNNPIECRLSIQVDLEQYQYIEINTLLNLKPNVRGHFKEKQFLSGYPIQIKSTLRPDVLATLVNQFEELESIPAYLLNLNQNQPDNPLLYTENWLCLSVEQQQMDSKIGYQTLWHYVNPSLFNQASISNRQIYDRIATFFKDSAQASWTGSVKAATEEILKEINQVFEELIDENFPESDIEFTESSQILGTVIKFFTDHEWPVIQLPDESVLQLTFQGENSQWVCYAEARELEQEFIFYSVFPVNTPEDKRLRMAEFLTRANHGLILGNFEMDLDSGEVYYKTSIDVKNDHLSFALIERLVYTNVLALDRYLPGMMAIIYGDILPVDAITQIDGKR